MKLLLHLIKACTDQAGLNLQYHKYSVFAAASLQTCPQTIYVKPEVYGCLLDEVTYEITSRPKKPSLPLEPTTPHLSVRVTSHCAQLPQGAKAKRQ